MGGIKAELGTEGGIRRCFEKGFEIEATKDSGKLIRLSDAGISILIDHGIGNGDKVRGATGGDSFGCQEREIGDGTLERTKRRSVNGMNNDGNTRTPRGQAPYKSRLPAVRVDDGRSQRMKSTREIQKGAEVEPGVDGPDESGNEVERELRCIAVRFERSFWTRCGTGKEVNVEVMVVVQAFDGGEGVFLCAADDETGDDV